MCCLSLSSQCGMFFNISYDEMIVPPSIYYVVEYDERQSESFCYQTKYHDV